jgi:hypothetical protein
LNGKVAAPGLENRDKRPWGSVPLTMRHPLYPQKFALTSPTSGGRSVGIDRLRAKAREFSLSADQSTNLIAPTVPGRDPIF